MRMNSLIALQGQSPDIVGSLDYGATAGRKARLSDLYQEHGAGIANGDQNALMALAQFDPNAALQVRDVQQGMQARAQLMGIRSKQEDRAAWTHAQRQEALETQRELEEQARIFMSAKTPEEWDQLARTGDMPQWVGGFDQRYNLIGQQVLPVLDQLHAGIAAQAAQQPDWQIVDGQAIDLNNPLAGAQDIPNVKTPEKAPDFKSTSDLRKEFSGLQTTKDFRQQATAFGRILASAKDPTPAGDLALIFNYMKVLDPGSVVRESEFATAESAAAWLQEQEQTGITVPLPIASAIRRMSSGQRLSAEQRADFVNRGQMLYDDAERQFDAIYGQYADIAGKMGIDASTALIDYRYAGEDDSAPPAPSSPSGPVDLTPEMMSVFQKYSQPLGP